jgi:UDP-N-acetylmuramate dehydrogenase
MERQELKDIFNEVLIEGEAKFMEPMSAHTSLRIGGPADIFVMPRTRSSLMNLHMNCKRSRIPFFPLGGGTNVLVRDGGIEGVVLSSMQFMNKEAVKEDDTHVYLSVDAGTMLQRLVNFSRENGYSGIEGLAGIPGTVGGAICGNAGAYGYEMKDVLVSVERMDSEGKIGRIRADEIVFGYRSSGILPGELVLSAVIKLRKDEKNEISARVENFLKMKRERQPLREMSAGCVFKNPSGVSAGKLVDEAGCKGLRTGDVEVSRVHANFFVNKGKARASDFLRLMEEVSHRVKEKFGVVLEPEIKIVGRDAVN